MSAEAARKAFSQEIEALRRQRSRLDPTEIARLALKAGLNAHEALLEIKDFYEYRHMHSGDFVDALPLFISSICRKSKARRILEYVSIVSLLTVHLAEEGESNQFTLLSFY